MKTYLIWIYDTHIIIARHVDGSVNGPRFTVANTEEIMNNLSTKYHMRHCYDNVWEVRK